MPSLDAKSSITARPPSSFLFALGAALLLSWGCAGDTGPQGPPGDTGPTDTHVERGQPPPGVNVAILQISGGSGSGGNFRVGNQVRVTYTLTKNDGTAWKLAEMGFGKMLVSGPTFNYQRVLPEVSDVATASVENADGSFTYTFADPIPATYAPPYNDTPSFGPGDGELTGEALLDGTYTVGLYFGWDYTVDGQPFRDVGNVEKNFLFGGAVTIDPREVVKQENCNQCHESLQAHGGMRRDVGLCVLCHTAGAEDKNDPSVANGTPGVSVDFRVMIHRIHNGAHLPSVLGVATNPDGSRNYSAAPAPYQIVGFGNSVNDFSDVHFPVWPNAQIAMPRDQGYSALPAPSQALEDTIRTGVASCSACHGDPDGAGPLTAPAQGDLYKSQPTRQACASCHDDIGWGSPYTSNGQTMPAQANNSNCILCHVPSGNSLAIEDAHRHPLNDPIFNPGVVINVSNIAEAGTNNGNGAIDPGEKVAMTFTIQNDAGADVDPATLASISAVLSGPTSNYTVILNASVPAAALTGTQPYTIQVPQAILLDFAGRSTAALDTFTTSRSPLWTPNSLTSVLARTATSGGSSALSSDAPLQQNFIDVLDATGFARNDYLVLDDGVVGQEEYLRIQGIDGTRLWFSSPATTSYAPGVRVAHVAGATVKEVTLTAVAPANYTVNAAAGQITETTEFGVGDAVLVSYTTDFVMPANYPIALNGSPDLDETWGKWTDKPIVAGTYSIGLWGSANLTLSLYGETNSYRSTSTAHLKDFLVGSATAIEPYALISSGDNCIACHKDIGFHGWGRRGFDACVVCHGTAGSEDRPRYVAGNAPPTTGATINFRTMLHKIHQGEELANASTYTVVGFGSAAWPNNFSANTYADVVFPALPGGTANCAKCHGDSNQAWIEPSDRNHPTDQSLPVRSWRAACGACHDSDAATAHIDAQTSGRGAESCSVCHGPGRDWSVQVMHKTY
jgi:OmcA/MtrC family decaheme c-type cytochrome